MPRLRSTRTGVVVSVDDATAARLGSIYYEPVKGQKADTADEAKPARRRTAKSDKS